MKDFRTDDEPANIDQVISVENDGVACDNEECYSDEAQEVYVGGDNDTQISAGVGDEIQCKICWGTENSADNPLLSTCKCAGTVRFIHFICLKTWLNTNISKKETPNTISMVWKTFECELCKKPYPCKNFLSG